MDILKAFSLVGDDYEINIQGTHENPLFRARDIGNILGLKKVADNILDFNSEEKVSVSTRTPGGMQDALFLTEIGLYRLIGRSRKPIAQVFQRWIINIVKEIRLTGMYALNLENEVDKKLHEQKCALSLHKKLMKIFHKENVIYIFKLKDDPDRAGFFIIKIGSTQNIKERSVNIARDYSVDPLLLDAFNNNNYVKTESVIHDTESIKLHKYTGIINIHGTKSREIYSVNNEIYESLLKIIEQINLRFSYEENPEHLIKIVELKNESERLKIQSEHVILRQMEIQLEMKKLMMQEPAKEVEKEFEKEPENEIIDPPVKQFELNYIKKRANGLYVPKVYQYALDDLANPIRIFDSPSEVERELCNVSQCSLKRASLENSIYKDYRWLYVNRKEEPPFQLEPTNNKKHKSSDIKFIAMLDVKRTKILAVYSTQKEAVEARNMKCNSFSRAIHQQTLSSGHYWNYFEDCSEEMQEEYLKTNKLPERHSSATGKQIQKLDPSTMKVLSVYNSKREIVKKYQTSYSKLNQLIRDNDNEIYQGFIWRAVN